MTEQRCVLEGFPRVGFYEGSGSPEDDLLPSCVKAMLQQRGDDLGLTARPGAEEPWHAVHCFLVGVSGCGFRRIQTRGAWDMGDGSPFVFTRDPIEPARRALAAAGWSCEAVLRPGFGGAGGPEPDPGDWRDRIVRQIRDRGLPVIAIGVIGPPEPCLVTGFDDGGETLIGWNAFQSRTAGLEFEPGGCFRRRAWFEGTQGLILAGAPITRPALRSLHRSALAYGLSLLRTPDVRGRAAGPAAFGAWADQLLREAEFTGLVPAELRRRFDVHHQRGGDLAEARAYAAVYLRQAADHLPEARTELLSAALAFDDEHDLVWAIWEFTGGMMTSDEGAARFASRYVRRRIAPLIRLARTRDGAAADHLDAAIRKIDAASHPVPGSGLEANGRTVSLRHSDRVWIDGVPDLRWGEGCDCTFLGSLSALSSVTERPLDYGEMIAATGIAFRLRWSNPERLGGWDMASPGGEYMEEWEDVQRATGFLLRAEFPGVTGAPADDPVVRMVRESIDAGWPVIAGVDGPDLGLIVGYAGDGATMIVRRYGEVGMRDCEVRAALGGFQLHRHGFDAPADAGAVIAGAVRTALRNWRRGISSAGYAVHGHEWYYGERALCTWIDDLEQRDVDAMEAAEGRQFHALNGWVYRSLLDARRSAAAWLPTAAARIGGAGGAALLRAADAYVREVAALEAAAAGARWLPADSPADRWTAQERRAEAAALRQALALEAEAMHALETAADSMADVAPPSAAHDPEWFAILSGVEGVNADLPSQPLPAAITAALRFLDDAADVGGLAAEADARSGPSIDTPSVGWTERLAVALERDVTLHPANDRPSTVRAIRDSIRAGRPVIAIGVVGDVSLVTGYDRGGDVLRVWRAGDARAVEVCDWWMRASGDGAGALLLIGDKRR